MLSSQMLRHFSRLEGGKFVVEKIADAFDREFCRPVRRSVRDMGILALPGKHGGHAVAPGVLTAARIRGLSSTRS